MSNSLPSTASVTLLSDSLPSRGRLSQPVWRRAASLCAIVPAFAICMVSLAPAFAQTVGNSPDNLAEQPRVRYDDQPRSWRDERLVRGFVGIGVTGGGDALVRAEYTDGTDYTLRAGGVVQIHGGAEFRLSRVATLTLAAGYHADSASARNGSITFGRYPVEALGHFYLGNHWRLGGGLRVAFRPRLDSDRFRDDLDIRFKTAYGSVLEVEYRFTPHLGLKGRAVFERYRSKGNEPAVDGNHVGLVFNYYF